MMIMIMSMIMIMKMMMMIMMIMKALITICHNIFIDKHSFKIVILFALLLIHSLEKGLVALHVPSP